MSKKIIISLFTIVILLGFSYFYLGCGKVVQEQQVTPGAISWSQVTSSAAWGAREGFSSVSFDNKIWVIGGNRGTNYLSDVWYSSNGKDWTQATGSAAFGGRTNHTCVVINNKMWVIGGYDGTNYYNDVWSSTDGVTWTQATASAAFSKRASHTSLVYNGQMWVIGGYDGTNYYNDVWSSTDGVTWTQATVSAGFSKRSELTSVVYSGKLWVIGGFNGTNYLNDIWFSVDGVNWNRPIVASASAKALQTTFPAGKGLCSFSTGDNLVVLYNNNVYSSNDGINWLPGAGAAGDHVTMLGNNIYVISSSGAIWKGILPLYIMDWTELSQYICNSFVVKNHTSLVFGGKMWIISGELYNYGHPLSEKPKVFSSLDGVTWAETDINNYGYNYISGHTSVVFDNKMWIIGGQQGSQYFNDVWSSPDGVTWTKLMASAIFPARAEHTSVVFDNKMWVIGGNNGTDNLSDVWSSTDGVTWTQVTASAAFGKRSGHTSVVFVDPQDNKEKMWVIGGNYSSTTGYRLGEIYNSPDGVNWTKVTVDPTSVFSARFGHSSVVSDNKMWVIGGSDGLNYFSDTWYSSDGKQWHQPLTSKNFSARSDHTSVVYPEGTGGIWVIGGHDQNQDLPAIAPVLIPGETTTTFPSGYASGVWTTRVPPLGPTTTINSTTTTATTTTDIPTHGVSWQPLSNGLLLGTTVRALALSGGLLKVGGILYLSDGSTGYAELNGSTWSGKGTMTGAPDVYAIAVANNGDTYIGGTFDHVGGVAANNIAMWNGTSWSPVGSGLDNTVRALAFDSSGRLYAGGDFSNHIKWWNGSSWAALAGGLPGPVYSLAFHPTSGKLYVGGVFNGPNYLNNIAMLESPPFISSWISLSGGTNGSVYALNFDPSGNLYVGGGFTSVTNVAKNSFTITANRIAKWDGSSWSSLNSAFDAPILALIITPGGMLYAGGNFTHQLASYNLLSSNPTWTFYNFTGNMQVDAFAYSSSDGSLYIGGDFTNAEGVSVNGIVKYTTIAR